MEEIMWICEESGILQFRSHCGERFLCVAIKDFLVVAGGRTNREKAFLE